MTRRRMAVWVVVFGWAPPGALAGIPPGAWPGTGGHAAPAAPSAVQEPQPPPLPVDPTLDPPPRLGAPSEEAAAPSPGARTLSLARAVSLSVQRNFAFLSNVDAVSTARYREGASKAQFYPQVTPRYDRTSEDSTVSVDAFERLPWTGGSISASGSLRSTPSAAAPFTKSSNIQVLLSQPLLRGFGPNATFFDLVNSRRNRESQERGLELARQRLAVDVASAFYQVVKQRQLLGVAQQSLKRGQSLKEASESRMKVGLASKLDVLRAELQSAQAQEAMVAAQSALDSALEQFRVLLGLSLTDPVEPEAVELPQALEGSTEPTEVLVARALQNRLDLQDSRDQVSDSQRAASLARQNLLPQLDLNVNLTQLGFGPTYSDSLSMAQRTVSVFLSTSYPLERSSDRANAAIAKLDVDSRTRALRQREMEIESDVRSAVRNLERIRKSVDLQSKGVEFASQQHRLATLRYQRGLASNFDVVDAEGSLVAARTALVGLRTDYEVARVQLLRATGTLNVAREFAP